MRLKRRSQPVTATPEQPTGTFHAAREPRHVESPYLDSRGASEYLQIPSLGALYYHIRENRLPVCRVGNGLRFDKRELDAWLRGTTAIELVRSRKRA